MGLAATVAGLALRGTSPTIHGTIEAFAAGAMLALVSETMIPEALDGSPQFNGLLLVAFCSSAVPASLVEWAEPS